jgi:hypothetical protein
MVVLGLLLLATSLFPESLTEAAPVLMGILLLAGVVVALVMQLSREELLRCCLGVFVLEELCVIACACGPYPQALTDGWHPLVFTTAVVLAGVLMLRMPLPEALLPLRGRWLRMFLAALSLGGLMLSGPWWDSWWVVWSYSQTGLLVRALLLLGIPLALWILVLAGQALATGLRGLGTWQEADRQVNA